MISQLLLAPNQLTLLRLIFIPFIIISILDGSYYWALILFILAGISDGLDGLAARLLKQKTTLGEYLDPIADKLLLSSLFLVLSFHHHLIPWKYTVLVFSRDLCILATCAVLYMVAALRDFRPSFFGKANTFAQVMAIFLVLFYQVHGAFWVLAAKKITLWTVFALTTVSGIHYVILAGHRMRSGQARTTVAGQGRSRFD